MGFFFSKECKKNIFLRNFSNIAIMTKRTFFGILIVVLLVSAQLNAQDLAHYKQIVKELSSSKYQGRGYAKDGANKAGKYLVKEFEKTGIVKELRARQQYTKPSVLKRLKMEKAVYVQKLRQAED